MKEHNLSTIDKLELNILFAQQFITNTICPEERLQKIQDNRKYDVYVGNKDNSYWVVDINIDEEFVIILNKDNPQIMFITDDNNIFFIKLRKK